MLPDPKFASLRDEARSLASRNREPRGAWNELNNWAFGKGPTAMKAAIMGFLDHHGSRPESAAIIPEIARAASQLPPMDRMAMLSLANRSFSMPASGAGAFNTKHGVAMRNDRPALSLTFNAKQGQKQPGTGIRTAPAVQAPDIAQMMEARDDIFRMSDRVRDSGAMGKPQVSTASSSGVKVAQVTSESFRPMLKSVDGHVLVRSLISRVRSHSSEGAYMPAPSLDKVVAKPAGKKARRVKTAARPAKRRKKAKPSAKRAKKSRRK